MSGNDLRCGKCGWDHHPAEDCPASTRRTTVPNDRAEMTDKPFTCDRCGASDLAVRHYSASGINLHDEGMCLLVVEGMPPASSPAHDPLTCPCCVVWGERCGSAEARLAEEQATIAEIEAAATRCGYDGEAGPLSDWIEAQHAEAARLRVALADIRDRRLLDVPGYRDGSQDFHGWAKQRSGQALEGDR